MRGSSTRWKSTAAGRWMRSMKSATCGTPASPESQCGVPLIWGSRWSCTPSGAARTPVEMAAVLGWSTCPTLESHYLWKFSQRMTKKHLAGSPADLFPLRPQSHAVNGWNGQHCLHCYRNLSMDIVHLTAEPLVEV